MNLTLKKTAQTARSLEKKYDTLYARAEKVLAKFNPCEVCKTKRGVECFDTVRNTHSRGVFGANKPITLCCINCPLHDKKIGCTAVKPLMCRLWVCRSLRKVKPDVVEQLDKIAREARPYGFITIMRADKPTALSYALSLIFRNQLERSIKTAPMVMSARFTL